MENTSPMKRIIYFLSQINRSKLILCLLISNLVLGMIIYEILFLIEPDFITAYESTIAEYFEYLPLTWYIAMVVIIGPFLEALIFQFTLLSITKKFFYWITKSDSWTPSFLVTSLIFSFAHATNFDLNYYGLLNAVGLIILAFSLTILAIVEIERKNGRPIFHVFILHGSYNLIMISPLVLSR